MDEITKVLLGILQSFALVALLFGLPVFLMSRHRQRQAARLQSFLQRTRTVGDKGMAPIQTLASSKVTWKGPIKSIWGLSEYALHSGEGVLATYWFDAMKFVEAETADAHWSFTYDASRPFQPVAMRSSASNLDVAKLKHNTIELRNGRVFRWSSASWIQTSWSGQWVLTDEAGERLLSFDKGSQTATIEREGAPTSELWLLILIGVAYAIREEEDFKG